MSSAHTAVLTIDLGNSGASAALVRLDGAEVVSSTRTALFSGTRSDDAHGALEALLAAPVEGAPAVERCAISAVGAIDSQHALERLVDGRGLDVSVYPSPGLDLWIESPETCGADRQYAMRAALERAAASGADRVIVVDAGTALTVDAGRIEGFARVFLGGAIAPGPGTLARALSDAGARLPSFDVRPSTHDRPVPALGRSTDDALRAGVVVGFRGTVAELARSVVADAFDDGDGVRVFLTGGARAFALDALEGVFGGTVVIEPSLVHHGLAIAAVSEDRSNR